MNVTRKAKREILALDNGQNFDDHIRQLYIEERTSVDFSVIWSVSRKKIKIVEHNSVDSFNLLKNGYKVVALISYDGETIDTQYIDNNYFEAFKNYLETTRF